MKWQYNTILFEFRKDGLLGDRYIDDDEMQEVLNDQGMKGWELVSVTPVQDGLLAFFKRGLRQPQQKVPAGPETASSLPSERDTAAATGKVPAASRERGSKASSQKVKEKPAPQSDVIGDIKIRS